MKNPPNQGQPKNEAAILEQQHFHQERLAWLNPLCEDKGFQRFLGEIVAETVKVNEKRALDTKVPLAERDIAAHQRETAEAVLRWPNEQRDASIRALKAIGERNARKPGTQPAP